jgi:hypothetical protein
MQATKHRVCAPSLQASPLPSVEVLPARRLLASRSAFHYCQQVKLLLLPAGQPIIFASIPASLLPAGQPFITASRSTYYFCQHPRLAASLLPAGQPLLIIPCLSTFYFASRSASNYCPGQPLNTTVSVPSSELGPHSLSRKRVCSSPEPKGGPNSYDWRKPSNMSTLCFMFTIYATAYITRSPYQLFTYWLSNSHSLIGYD